MNIDVPNYTGGYGMNGHSNISITDINIQQRASREFVPADKKDDKYWFKRVRNNASARKSRMKRKTLDKVVEGKLLALQKENLQLRNELTRMSIFCMQRSVGNVNESIVTNKETIMRQFEEYRKNVEDGQATRTEDRDTESDISDDDQATNTGTRDSVTDISDDDQATNTGTRDSVTDNLEDHTDNIRIKTSFSDDLSSMSSGKSEMNDFRNECESSPFEDNQSVGSNDIEDYMEKYRTIFPTWVLQSKGIPSLSLNIPQMIQSHIGPRVNPPGNLREIRADNYQQTFNQNKQNVPLKMRFKKHLHSAFSH